MDCFGTYFTHAQSCDNVRVQTATEWTASVHTLHMPKAVITFVFKVLRNGLLRYIYFTHAQSCDNVRVPSAPEWTASVHTLHMPKAVITFVFQVLLGACSICAFSRFRVFVFSRFLRFRVFCVFVLHSFSSFRAFAFACFRIFADFKMLYGMDCFGTYFTHAQSCDNVRVQSATEWTASVHTLDMLIML